MQVLLSSGTGLNRLRNLLNPDPDPDQFYIDRSKGGTYWAVQQRELRIQAMRRGQQPPSTDSPPLQADSSTQGSSTAQIPPMWFRDP